MSEVLIQRLQHSLSGELLAAEKNAFQAGWTITVSPTAWYRAFQALKESFPELQLVAMHALHKQGRQIFCAELFFPASGERFSVRTVPAGYELESLATLFAPADWLEQEAFELFGVSIRNVVRAGGIFIKEPRVKHPLREGGVIDAI